MPACLARRRVEGEAAGIGRSSEAGRGVGVGATPGAATIGWGAGDPGYKTEMGAEAGHEILDYLIVRGGVLAALARPFWERRG